MKQFIILGGFIISLVFPRRDCLKQTETDALGRSTRPEKDTFAISDSGHFYIHYDTTGNAAPDLTDNNRNGIPDYIDEVGMIADSAYHVLVNIMHFSAPPVDEDSLYDIYIKSYSPGSYGENFIDSPSQNTNGATSYLKIDNDYSGFNSIFDLTPLQIMQISVGHEYFHGIQWGYRKNKSGNEYFYEMTSMWFEDILIPNGNDYLDGWPDPLLNNPTAEFDNTGGGYELALFGHYLSSFIDTKGRVDATQSTIMREIWEIYRDFPTSAFSAVKYILQDPSYNTSFIEVWVDFMSRNLYNGIYEDMDNDFYYYSDQALIDHPIQTTAPTLNDSIRFELDLDNKSVAIQSYSMGDLNTIVEIKHVPDDYIGRVATVSKESNINAMFLSRDTLSQELYPDDKIHFIYGIDQLPSTMFIEAIPHTVPIPPSRLAATAAQDSILLNWNPSPGPGDNLKYIIYRDGESIFQTIDTNYTDSQGISGSIYYKYSVSCNNDFGESQLSGIVSIQSWPNEDSVATNQILSIYPNPMHKTYDAHILYALGMNYSNTILELINIRGQIVNTVALQSYQRGWHRESINNLVSPEAASGIYIIRLRPENRLGCTQKITILP